MVQSLLFCRYLFSSERFGLLEMAAKAASSLQMARVRPCISTSHRAFKAGVAFVSGDSKKASLAKLASAGHLSSAQPLHRSFMSSSVKLDKFVTKAMAEFSDSKPVSGLSIDLRGLFFFIFLEFFITQKNFCYYFIMCSFNVFY